MFAEAEYDRPLPLAEADAFPTEELDADLALTIAKVPTRGNARSARVTRIIDGRPLITALITVPPEWFARRPAE